MKAVLFDLDGTLLPMDQGVFTNAYFQALSHWLASFGHEPEKLVAGVLQGTKAMIKNDGRQTNEQVFWNEFSKIFGEKVHDDREKFDAFYVNDFDNLKSVCRWNGQANQMVQFLKEQGFRLVLASNPVFPLLAQQKRMAWAGLNVGDFEYITAYENSHYCKPNPQYYREIADEIGVNPNECVMVGNDTTEDMVARGTGMKVFLLTNCLINTAHKNINDYPRGNFEQLINFVKRLNKRQEK